MCNHKMQNMLLGNNTQTRHINTSSDSNKKHLQTTHTTNYLLISMLGKALVQLTESTLRLNRSTVFIFIYLVNQSYYNVWLHGSCYIYLGCEYVMYLPYCACSPFYSPFLYIPPHNQQNVKLTKSIKGHTDSTDKIDRVDIRSTASVQRSGGQLCQNRYQFNQNVPIDIIDLQIYSTMSTQLLGQLIDLLSLSIMLVERSMS
eukprot:TRINITY_DN376_c9_g1_i1.p1 TRINITY_DN376_c9_g1~~TRINITY_DN376_c9_g1_i1.p1  ORF type:complete len:202 (+),score=-17.10 TRINITY_DN376_c9_g1_i1:357-962(+)